MESYSFLIRERGGHNFSAWYLDYMKSSTQLGLCACIDHFKDSLPTTTMCAGVRR